MKQYILLIFLNFFIQAVTVGNREKTIRPQFTTEPPFKVVFSNKKGVRIPCSANGDPRPLIYWVNLDGSPITNIAGIRMVEPDGHLVFLSFFPNQYRDDTHNTVYRCVASNHRGMIGSRAVNVTAVIEQPYEVNVYDERAFLHNSVVMTCIIPSFIREHVEVTKWIREDGFSISTESHYEVHTPVPPQIVYKDTQVESSEGEKTVLACVAQGYPAPLCSWSKWEGSELIPVYSDSRRRMLGCSLEINRVTSEDSSRYICEANNTVGKDVSETKLVVYVPLRVEVLPTTQTVNIGETVRFSCSVTGFPVQKVIWMKDVQPLQPSGRKRILYNNVLEISPIVRQDKGIYQCFVSNSISSEQSSGALLLSEEAPVFREIFQSTTLQPNTFVSLRCAASGNPLPQITWKLDELSLPDILRLRVGDFVTHNGYVVSHVNISNVRPEDGGTYSCNASNEVGTTVYHARVNIYGPPVIRTLKNRTILAGSSLVIYCPVGGFPITKISWKKDNKQLPQNHRQRVFENGTLVVNDVTRKTDQGTYTCIAWNKQGNTATQDVFVEVSVAPKINQFDFSSDLEEGMRSIVMCAVIAGDPPIRISWLKDGKPLSPGALGASVESLNEYSSTLTFNAVKAYHAGNYTCVARNSAAVVNFTAEMVVNVAPYWKIEPTDQSTVAGKTLMINCQAGGFPLPQIRWKVKSGTSRTFHTVVSNPHIHTLENGSLLVRGVHLNDSGQYMCQAANEIGPDLSVVITLSVHIPPHIKTQFQSVTVQKSKAVNLSCEVLGDRPLSIKWTKNGQHLDLQNRHQRYTFSQVVMDSSILSTFKIISAKREDTSLFGCSAENNYGQDQMSFQVIVQDVPDAPQDLKAIQVTSRSVTVAWQQPYSGNLPLKKYIVQYTTDTEEWTRKQSVLSVSNMKTEATVGGLSPQMSYKIRILAENSLGHGPPSKVLAFTTEKAAPTTPVNDIRVEPTSSHSLHITWKPPTSNTVEGYYIGYKIWTSNNGFTYKTVEATGEEKQMYTLTNLRRFTKYVIHIQAYNSAGRGPLSNEVLRQTLEYDPPNAPDLKLVSDSSRTIHLYWEDTNQSPVISYIIYYKEVQNEWKVIEVPGKNTTYTISNLRCGTQYEVYLMATNTAGSSNPSEVLSVKTSGTVPRAPDKYSFLTINSTFVVLHLYVWKTSGCPVDFFVIQMKVQGQSTWQLVSDNVSPQRQEFCVPNLNPGSWYNLLVSAHNSAGSTDAEYVFSTLTEMGATVSPPLPAQTSSQTQMYRWLTLIIPVVCAVVIVMVVTVIICLLHTRRHRPNNHQRSPAEAGDPHMMQKEALNMTALSTKIQFCPRDSTCYPSPYAMTRVPGYPQDDGSDGGSQLSDARSPGETHRSHTYDVPFLVRQVGGERCVQTERVALSPIPALNIYQVPQTATTEQAGGTSLAGSQDQRFSTMSDSGVLGPKSVPSSRRWSSGYRGSLGQRSQQRPCIQEYRRCTGSDTDSDTELTPSQMRDGDIIQEMSETECDLDAKQVAAGNKQLRVAIPPELHQSVGGHITNVH
ncbi:Down syndrome cell adhesion molecule-like protein Dscam2 isoform X3 [Limulus polyphemus]|uniref:Down syndrome cell adhesion molecule-like protein Dscam2 isoform X3 n=1 Tax=Limulus polyphemus TaxID=6850 RepID=A0ABM1S661_LIMPO|nr:Down syndrome cell adhesion molecule-like protein Dscam2 isoform X3 [Limulus polyphemus]